MSVILLTADLTVLSRVEGAAARTGAIIRAVSCGTAALDSCKANQAELVIVDLNSPSLDINTLVARLSETSAAPRIVAFGPHVHEERLAAAREAGCDAVVSRGKFFAQLDAILVR